jgi:hypothetical protein
MRRANPTGSKSPADIPPPQYRLAHKSQARLGRSTRPLPHAPNVLESVWLWSGGDMKMGLKGRRGSRQPPGLSVFVGHGVSASAPGGQNVLARQGSAAAPGGPKLPRTGMQSNMAEAPAGDAVLGGQGDGSTAPRGQNDPAGQSETSSAPGGPKYPAMLCRRPEQNHPDSGSLSLSGIYGVCA